MWTPPSFSVMDARSLDFVLVIDNFETVIFKPFNHHIPFAPDAATIAFHESFPRLFHQLRQMMSIRDRDVARLHLDRALVVIFDVVVVLIGPQQNQFSSSSYSTVFIRGVLYITCTLQQYLIPRPLARSILSICWCYQVIQRPFQMVEFLARFEEDFVTHSTKRFLYIHLVKSWCCFHRD